MLTSLMFSLDNFTNLEMVTKDLARKKRNIKYFVSGDVGYSSIINVSSSDQSKTVDCCELCCVRSFLMDH